MELKRTWKTGDRVQLTLPKALRLDLTPDNKRRAAILWGPLVLAGDLGPEPPRAGRGLNADGSALVEAPRPVATPMLVAAERPIADWLKPVAGKPGTFRTAGVAKDQDLELSPFYRLHRRTYAAYWDLFTPPEYDAKLAEIAAERERLRKLDAVTVAFLRPGDGQREKEFNQQGEETSIVRADDRAGRRGTKWFSYDMPLEGGAANVLVVTYQTDNRRIRTFDILVEGQRVASQTLEPNGESRFFDVEYPLPPALVAGKPKVDGTVRGDQRQRDRRRVRRAHDPRHHPALGGHSRTCGKRPSAVGSADRHGARVRRCQSQ